MPQSQRIVCPLVQPERARLPRPEELLIDYARRLQRHRKGRRALWFHLSRLGRQNRHESDIQLAANLLAPLAHRYQGEVFALGSGDIVVCLKDPNPKEVDTAIFDLRFSFAQDPLMRRADKEGTHLFLTTYDIAERYDAFLERAAEAATGESPPGVPTEPEEAPPTGLGERLMLSRDELRRASAGSDMVGHIDTSQGRIAVERLLERRDIVAFEGGARPRHWGLRESVRIEAIDAFDALAMALARRQLDQSTALAEIERILLSGLAEHLRARAESHHIVALRIEALMSPEFLIFDRQLKACRQALPWIAFWASELRGDHDTVGYLKAFMRERGYPLGATGVELAQLPDLSPALAGLQFLEIDHAREIEARDAELLERLVDRLGAGNVIVSELRSQKALVIARRIGIKLTSGPVIDAVL